MRDANEQLRSLLPPPEEPNSGVHRPPPRNGNINSSSNSINKIDYGTTATTTHADSDDDWQVLDNGVPPLGRASDDGICQQDDVDNDKVDRVMPLFTIVAILSTAFSYGCILTTLFLITIPIECERIHLTNGGVPKSVALGVFVAIAGFTQLVSPLVGRASDTYEPPRLNLNNMNGDQQQQQQIAELGQRLPYYMFGAAFAGTGLLCQMLTSYAALWVRYTFSFFFSMVGLNIQYAMMLALIPDQVPRSQTGIANGILALLLVTGSIFGFGLFHVFLTQDDIGSMYGLYASIVILTSILTGSYAQDRDAELAAQRMELKSLRAQHASLLLSKTGQVHQTGITPEDEDSHSDISIVIPFPSKDWPMQARRATKKAMIKAVKRAHEIVLTPALIANSMAEPFRRLTGSSVLGCYTIDIAKHHDFFIVTLSRLFYYCGMSVQTFFLYFVHDIIHVRTHPEAAVAILAIIGQCSGALTCYPVGILSDRLLGGRRTPFVYASCAILATATLTLVFATTFHQMILFCLVLGAANGAYLTAETSLAVDTLPNEFDLDDDGDDDSGSGQLLGIWGVAAFLGSALGPMIGGPLLYMFGTTRSTAVDDGATVLLSGARNEDEGVYEEYSLTGYAVVLSLSAFYFLCSALTLRFLKGCHDE